MNITDDRFTFARNTAKIDAEAALDGVYVVRTTVAEAVLDQTAAVTAYKQLSTAERAFRSLKRCGRSIIAAPTAYGPTCSYSCSPITSNGTCA